MFTTLEIILMAVSLYLLAAMLGTGYALWSMFLRHRALCDVVAERRRQIGVEGWTAEHDDKHARGEMARAAACYALSHQIRNYRSIGHTSYLMDLWPWGHEWWKPTPDNRIRELAKAGALILAEIEREYRMQKRAAKAKRLLSRSPALPAKGQS